MVQQVGNYEVRSYIPEKQQKGRRNWQGKAEEQRAVYANRQRVRSYGKATAAAARWWNTASRIAERAACGAAICRDGRTF